MTAFTYLILGFFLVLGLLLKSPKVIGLLGEKGVQYRLVKSLDSSQYTIMHDVYLPNEKNGTTQIDLLILSEFGVFVVEVKNYTGWIVGNEKSEYWTQVIYKRKEKLYNPLRQNFGHVESLKTFFPEFSDLFVVPIVSFSGRAELKVEVKSANVVYNKDLAKSIKSHTNKMISREQLDTLIDRIKQFNSTIDPSKRKQHVKAIKSNLKSRAQSVENNVCPKCGSSLVMKEGRYGAFKGCSGYPKCRFIVKQLR
jgi:hypothetical protein